MKNTIKKITCYKKINKNKLILFHQTKGEISMKLNVRLARLFGLGMLLTILSFVMLQAQPDVDWRKIGPWSGNITDVKVKFVNDIMRNNANGPRDSLVVASYGAGVFIADILDASGVPTKPPIW
jgi:hypothetical protein